MLLVLVQLAFGSQCVIRTQQVFVQADGFHTRGTLSVSAHGGWPTVHVTELANRFRLRAPDQELVPWTAEHLRGEVRFTPVTALPPGRYTLEMHAEYGADGRQIQLGTHDQSAASGWFPYERYDVQVLNPATLPALIAPTDASWSRFHSDSAVSSSGGDVVSLTVEAKAPPGTRIELEVDGIGTIAHTRANGEGEVRIRASRSMCVRYPTHLPLPGDLRVRLVSVGLDGNRAAGPWKVLGPSLPVRFEVGAASAPSGIPAKVGEIETWAPLDLEPVSGPSATAQTTCGRLVAQGNPTPMKLEPDERVFVDSDQQLHRLAITNGKIQLDGADLDWVLPSRERAQLYLTGASDGLTIGVHEMGAEWLYLLQLDGSKIVKQTELFGVTQVTALDRDGAELRVLWTEGHGVRWAQRFDAALSPLGGPSEIVHPIRIETVSRLESGAGWGIAVNGHPVDLLDLHHFSEGYTVFDGRAYIPARGEEGGRIAVVRADGTLAWSVDLEALSLRAFAVDSRGVHLHLRDYRSQQQADVAATYTHDGKLIVPPLEMPTETTGYTPVSPPVVRRLTHGSRTLVVKQTGRARLGVEENGSSSPMVPIAWGAVLAVRPDGAEVVWRGSSDPLARGGDDTYRQTYVCSGESVGVPEVWTGSRP